MFDTRERAYRGSLERDDRAGAARMAVWLAWDTAAFRGEAAVASGWLQRARRLLEGHPDAPENAWLALRAGVFALLDDGDPEEAEKLAGEAVQIGQRDRGLRAVGRALHGFARVSGARSRRPSRARQVNAAVLAGEMTTCAIGLACCYLIAACERIRDFDRAAQWCDRLKAFCTRWGLRPLFAVCRTQYASVCMWRGAWDEAERELVAASDELAASRPAMTGEGFVRLGELRRRQGKLDEAMGSSSGRGAPMASLGRAAVIFDRGDFKTAAELAERHLRLPAKRDGRAAARAADSRAGRGRRRRGGASIAGRARRRRGGQHTDACVRRPALAAGAGRGAAHDAKSASATSKMRSTCSKKLRLRRAAPAWRRSRARRSGTAGCRGGGPAVRSTFHIGAELGSSRLEDAGGPKRGSPRSAPTEKGGLTAREPKCCGWSQGPEHARDRRPSVHQRAHRHRHVANTLTKLNVRRVRRRRANRPPVGLPVPPPQPPAPQPLALFHWPVRAILRRTAE